MKRILLLLVMACFAVHTHAQTGTEFWFAPPEVTSGHGGPNGDEPILLRIATGNVASTVTIDMPALGGAAFGGAGTLTATIPANSQQTFDLSVYKADLETPSDVVSTTGLHVVATESVTVYYELNTTYNPEIFALKGANGLGTEFYTPFNTRWRNGNYTPTPYTSFDIVATEDNTTVIIYPRKDLDGGHTALTSYTVTLMRGETYSGSVTSTVGADNPAGTAIVSDKPIAVSVKDDSAWPQPWGGCKDLMGDQIVPVDIVGYEYIVAKGFLNANIERMFITATQNNAQITIDDGTTTNVTLFAGETYDFQLDNPFTHIISTEPIYVMHISGYGCEMGAALLPPLNCAGSDQVSFVRSKPGPSFRFGLSVMVPTGAEGDFAIDGNTTLLQAADFSVVPGTGGAWMAAAVEYTEAEIASLTAHLVTNGTEPFGLGVMNGGTTSGCRYGYFSEFSAEIVIDAGLDQTICANDTAQLSGSVTGGATTGIWTSSGSGQFLPNDTDMNAEYVPSPADISAGSVSITLTSTGSCTPVTDVMTLNITPAPTVDAGADVSVCENNPDVNLNGTVTIAASGIWSGGAGSYSPNNTSLITTYTPSAAEIASGSVTLTLTTTGNGICNPETDNITITFTPSPTVDAGPNQSVCGNNPDATLSGAVTVATGGVWSGGAGTFSPNVNALNATYTPTAAEVATGSVTLTLTTTGNGTCNSESDNVTITYTTSPTANAGVDQTLCANNAAITLNGSVTVSTGGVWSGGLGTYAPNANTLNAVYTPTAAEISSGSLTLTLTTTGNGTCNAVTDDMTVTFTAAPTVNANVDQTVCANNPDVTLNGSITIATGGVWSGGAGTFNPNANTLNATYTPTAGEIAAGTVTLTLTTTGNGTCNAESDDMEITIDPAPVVSAGTDATVCANNPDVTLGGSISNAGGGVWSGGAGTFNPSNAALNATYTPSAAEIAAGTVTLTLTSTGNGLCNAESDNVTITITTAPTANAGVDQTVCSNNPDVTLGGSVTVATGGSWSGGAGTYSPDANTLNAVYTPSAAEITAGSVTLTLTTTGNGTCIAVTDDMTISFSPSPTSDAGADQTVCANNPDVTLGGSVTIATGGVWSGGAGTFNPNANTLNATYTPTAGEIAAGTVTLTLTTTGNGTCNAESDDMEITIDPAPVVSAGTDATVCANNPDVTLGGSISNAGGGVWSGGAGTFNPSNAALNATYTPSAAEIAAGTVTLTLTSTGNGLCNAESDNVTITITTAPTANAGVDQTVCSNNPDVTLGGSVTVATGGSWSGGAGTYSPDANTLNAVYTPSAAEITAGSVTLTLTTTGNGTCIAVTDDMTISFSPSPTSDAGADQTVCANNPDVTLGGSVTVASGGAWSGGAGTFTPNANTLNATYTPTAGEIAAGTVTLTLTTTGNGTCNAVSDDMDITIDPAPSVSAGPDFTVCANNADVTLSGSVSFAGGGVWSGGSGTFNPSNTTLNATYTPSAAEITAGTVTLTLTSTGNGLCNAESDDMIIAITPAPVVNAGTDQTLCANNADISLSGSLTGATGGQWTGGLGVFTPDNNTLNAIYSPTAAEIASGTLTLTLSSTGNGNCNAVTDDMTVTFTASPTVDAGPDASVCANSPNTTLAGVVTVASGGVWLGGGGTYTPSATDLNATYTPSAAEIAAGSVTLTLQTTGNGNCLAETDDMTIIIDPEPITNAGPNVTSCANNPNVNLAGVVTNAGGGIWSGGGGSYNASNTDLNAIYTPSPAEITAGTATLTLTSTGNGSCAATFDQMDIAIVDAPSADAGVDQTLCANNADITLTGSVTGASGGQWSGGLGLFTPSNNALNAVYTPTAGEVASGTLTLTLTTTGNGTCNPESDDIAITFTQAPTADAGVDITVCENNSVATLAGNVSIATGGMWSGGGGTFSPSNTDLNATYTPTAAEIAAGSVTLTLTTTGNGNCSAESDDVLITIDPVPTVTAGADQIICVNNLTVPLSGSVSGITNSGQWTTSGSGVFVPNNTTLSATYIPSTADSIAGSVTLTLESTNNGVCLPIQDDMTVSILPAGVADAGSDVTVCANNASVTLNGNVSGGATTGVWTTTGTGVFTPNDSTLNATYVPSAFDAANGSVTLTLTANSCDQDTDDMVITITPEPVVDAGPDQTVCASNLNIPLIGSVTGASTTGVWTTSGTGTFTPSNTDLNATYVASSADSVAQGVTIVLEATGIGTCVPVTDTVIINIYPTGTADAGADQTLCANNGAVALNGVISGGATEGIWTTSGTGVFVPSDTVLNATYLPGAADTTNGIVNLVLTSTNSCNTATDFMVVNYSPAPFVDAGASASMCGSNPVLNLSGTVNGATGGIWTTSGTGTFTPNDIDMNATYNATAADIASGSVTLYLTTTGNGSCNPEVDSMIISITSGILVDAGPDQTVCSTAGFTNLQGNVSNGSTTGVWSTLGSGTFQPNDSLLTGEYHFSAGDVTAGSTVLVLTSTNNGSCAAETDTVVINYGSTAYADAGADQIVCASNSDVALNGFVSGGATEGQWISLGSGTFSPADTLMSTTYLPSATDSINGFVEIVLVTTDHGSCTEGRDTMMVTIEPVPSANAGTNIQICASVDSIPMSGSVTNASGGVWTTSGTGSFSPNDTTLNASYVPSTADLAGGSITIYLTTTGSTICAAETDSITIDLVTPLVADFGFEETCYGLPMNFYDSSVVSTGTILSWSWDFGDGDSSSAQNPIHVYGTPGTYDVTFEVESSLGCSYQVIQTITVHDAPIAGFGMSASSVELDEVINFTDASSGASVWSWSFGDGFGVSSDQNPNYTYGSAGDFEVTQIVYNSFGCSDTAVAMVTITDEQLFPPAVPSGFSPNGDGENDELKVLGGPFVEIELKVYNNWGNLIFESTVQEEGWDGTWKGKAQPKGDYIYTVKAITVEGEEFNQHGSVSIIR